MIETKVKFVKDDEQQLIEYVEEEKALHPSKKIIAMLANTGNDEIKVWINAVTEGNFLPEETKLDEMDHYRNLFQVRKTNDKEAVMKNTYDLNELLHKVDIDERIRSQFVGTALLYIKDKVQKNGSLYITEYLMNQFNEERKSIGEEGIILSIRGTLQRLLDGSENKETKVKLLERNILEDQKVQKLKIDSWIDILDFILMKIFKNINDDSSEGQDILNLFFIAFNKYT